jgi:hypothetical protein
LQGFFAFQLVRQGIVLDHELSVLSGAGLGSFSWNQMSVEQNNWLNTVQKHLVRLNEFSGEFSGQVPNPSYSPEGV